jgi:hypothetical protein
MLYEDTAERDMGSCLHHDEPARRFRMREKLIERDGDTVALASRRWFRVRDAYGVEVNPRQDEALLLAAVVAQ